MHAVIRLRAIEPRVTDILRLQEAFDLRLAQLQPDQEFGGVGLDEVAHHAD